MRFFLPRIFSFTQILNGVIAVCKVALPSLDPPFGAFKALSFIIIQFLMSQFCNFFGVDFMTIQYPTR